MSTSARVLAFTEDNGDVTLVRDLCQDSGCAGAELERLHIPKGTLGIDDEDVPEQLLLSGTGDWLAFKYAGKLNMVDLDCALGDSGGSCNFYPDEDIEGLVGTLRSNDWVVYRTASGLRARNLALGDGTSPVELGGDYNLLAVALGDRTVVARRIINGDEEELYLIRVNPTKKHDISGYDSAGRAVLLGRGQSLSRVIVTRGPTPAELGEHWEPDQNTPIDEYVVATYGEGEDAHTVVYRVMDGSVVDSFPGAALSSHVPLDEIPGLSAVSPDSSHLAYVTPSGAAAMRNLDSQGACLVRSAVDGRHTIAGFARDGGLYLESREEDEDGQALQRVGLYDPTSLVFDWITGADEPSTLRAVPSSAAITDGGLKAWAITARNGFFGVQAGDDPQPLGLEPSRVSFIPRITSDDSMWLIEAGDDNEQFVGTKTTMRLKKIRASADADTLDFDAQDSDPVYEDPDDGEYKTVEASFTSKYQICVTTARPGGWGSTCAKEDDPVAFLRAGPETGP